MNDSFKTIALLVCGAVLMAGFKHTFTVKQAEARPYSVEPVQNKWDYRIVTYEHKYEKILLGGRRDSSGNLVKKPASGIWWESPAVGEKVLSDETFFKRFGDRGWELVQVLRTPTDGGYKKQWYFKKPL